MSTVHPTIAWLRRLSRSIEYCGNYPAREQMRKTRAALEQAQATRQEAADTLCWACSRAYSITDRACPHCGAVNGNVDLRAALAQIADGSGPVGYGATEQEAIDDLLDQLEDADELDAGETAHGDLIRLQLMRRDLQAEKERLKRERNDLTEIIDRLSHRIARIDEQLAVAGILTRAEGSA